MYRGWHNMNSRYNGYFYANENQKESVKKVEKANKDDFSKLIPIYIYPDKVTAKNFYTDFDKTIKKSSTVIQRHAIVDKKTKEEIPNACHWIDENYMLIGQAHFYKNDFFSALEAFEYVSKKYPNPGTKYLAMLWLIRTNNEIGSFSKSELIIDELRNAKDFSKERSYQQEFAAVTADYYIKHEEYSAAIKFLTRAITLTRKKSIRARLTFVLAQLYERQGDNKNASMYYGMVSRLHPVYEMAFNAQINQAKLFDIESGDSRAIKKQLAKMLKDDKNIEYRDQIYYALAEIAYQEKLVPLSLNYLNKSIRASVSNKTQKALSYLRRADIYFERPDYEAAQANYDSTMAFLPKDYPNYNQIEGKKKSLTILVVNLKVIALEDSLQVLAKMSEKDRNSVIDKMIEKIEEEEKAKEEEKQDETLNEQSPIQNQTPTTTTQQTGSWYFYNPSTVSFGAGEFQKKWGSRNLEDNWRRSEKEQVIAASSQEESETLIDSTEKKDISIADNNSLKNKKDKNYYLKKIPLTADALDKSNLKIIDAYYNVGSIYKEQLFNNKKSVEAFETLMKRFPENKLKLSCYYQLYRTYLAMEDIPKSDYYKDLILKDFPDSEFAKIIKNPEHAKDLVASKSEVEKFYTETYQLYAGGKYSEALANCQKAENSYSKNHLMPQFAFIKALCIGRTQDISAFEAALTQVVVKYAKEPVKEKAQDILDAIKKQKTPVIVNPEKTDTVKEVKSKFTYTEDGDYYWITIVENGKGDIDKLKIKISDLNAESFSTKDLTIATIFLDINHQLLSVKKFVGKKDAMDYYNFFKEKKEAFASLEAGTFQTFIISAENYSIFYKDKNLKDYQEFFIQNFK